MKEIASFTIDHTRLERGLYVSRKDKIGDIVLTTFDLRMTRPNFEPVMNTGEIHAIEHLGATYLRNHKDYKDKVIYFGPMGCRTGFYLILAGDYSSSDILPLIIETFEYMVNFKDIIPGASPEGCGNYLDMNLNMGQYFANRYLKETLYPVTKSNLEYPKND